LSNAAISTYQWHVPQDEELHEPQPPPAEALLVDLDVP
jgi:hypothetical protein